MHLWGLVPIDSMKMCYAALARDFSRGGKKKNIAFNFKKWWFSEKYSETIREEMGMYTKWIPNVI